MDSLKNTVVRTFGADGESVPEFRCPVVVAPLALSMTRGMRDRVHTLVNEAALAADLLAGFGDRSGRVDFASVCAPRDWLVPVAMRAEAITTDLGPVVRIDVAPALASNKAVR